MDDDWRCIQVPIDTDAFKRDVAAMRGTLEGALGQGAERAGRSIEMALLRAAQHGKLGFEDLKAVALKALGEIAKAALANGLHALTGGIGGGRGGDGGANGGGGLTLGGALTALIGLAGRATGGPVAPGQAYVVGERGPELFVPTAAGRVEVPAASGARDVRVAITINAGAGEAPAAMQRSARQVAQAVRAALAD
ncbi:tail tape measure protein [Sphingomonas sp. XXL09]|uniref:tail tape measure protein n=1 Tax=Sphingomonas sp. XXL09 TaxID=3457787 RepID=UPI00406BB2A3